MADYKLSNVGKEYIDRSRTTFKVAHASGEYLMQRYPVVTHQDIRFASANKEYLLKMPTRMYAAVAVGEYLMQRYPTKTRHDIRFSHLNKEYLLKMPVRMYIGNISREFITQDTPVVDRYDFRMQWLNRELIYRVIPYKLQSVNREIIYKYLEKPTIKGQVVQAVNYAVMHAVWPTLNDTISAERVVQSRQLVTVKSPAMPFYWSNTRVSQEFVQVLQSKPSYVQGVQHTKQVRALVAGEANYTLAEDVWSKSSNRQTVMLSCQSIDIPYQPVSGEYMRQNRLLVVQADVKPFWISPVSNKLIADAGGAVIAGRVHL